MVMDVRPGVGRVKCGSCLGTDKARESQILTHPATLPTPASQAPYLPVPGLSTGFLLCSLLCWGNQASTLVSSWFGFFFEQYHH